MLSHLAYLGRYVLGLVYGENYITAQFECMWGPGLRHRKQINSVSGRSLCGLAALSVLWSVGFWGSVAAASVRVFAAAAKNVKGVIFWGTTAGVPGVALWADFSRIVQWWRGNPILPRQSLLPALNCLWLPSSSSALESVYFQLLHFLAVLRLMLVLIVGLNASLVPWQSRWPFTAIRSQPDQPENKDQHCTNYKNLCFLTGSGNLLLSQRCFIKVMGRVWYREWKCQRPVLFEHIMEIYGAAGSTAEQGQCYLSYFSLSLSLSLSQSVR